MKKVLIHVAFVLSISFFFLVGIAGINEGGASMVAGFCILLGDAMLFFTYREVLHDLKPPPADKVEVNIMPMSEFQEKYGGTFKVHNAATGETIITTTTPNTHLNDVFDLSDMD